MIFKTIFEVSIVRTKEEVQKIISEILTDLREQAGVSKSKMADKMGIDARTYARYESGESTPTLSAFIEMIESTGMPVLSIVLRHLYPESYGRASESSTIEIRKSLANFIMEEASDKDIRRLAYVATGPHGSQFSAQVQLFTALDHLPMEDRLAIAKLVLNFWEIESERGNVINKDLEMPDAEMLRAAIIKAHRAVIDGKGCYASAIK